MKIQNAYDDVTLAVLWRGFRAYSWRLFQRDSMAAISVALISIPISMAYALAAGFPPSVGLFAAIFGSIFAAAFGSSRQLVVGPTNMTAILIQAGISEILYTYYRDATGPERAYLANQVLIQLTLIVGLLQFFAGIFKLGRLTQFVSRSVVLGYVVGTALALIITQLYYFLGINPSNKPQPLFGKAWVLITHVGKLHWPTTFIGIGSIVLLMLSEKISRRFPSAIFVLIVATLAVMFFKLSPTMFDAVDQVTAGERVQQIVLIRDFGELHNLIPIVDVPFLDLHILNTLLPIGFAISLLGILEATSIARSIAAQTGQVLSINQEIFALGSANALSSIFGAMPSSGSFARSSLNFTAGAKTRFSAVLSGILIAAIIFMVQPAVLLIPLTALAALLIVSAFRMMNRSEIELCFKATGSDAVVFLATTLSCILLNVDIAFYIGVVLSIVFYLRKAAIPHFEECQIDKTGHFILLAPNEIPQPPTIRILHVEGELFFGAADLLQTTVKRISQDPDVKVILLHLGGAHHIDATFCVALQQIHRYLKGTGRFLIVSGLTKPVWQVLTHSGLALELGLDNLFLINEHDSSESTRHAYRWAESLLKPPLT